MLLAEIAKIIDGTVIGDAQFEIDNISSLESAKENSLACFYNTKYSSLLKESNAGVVLIEKKYVELFNRNKIVVDNPYLAYAKISYCFQKSSRKTNSIDSSALISKDVEISNHVEIGHYSVIEAGVKIENGVKIGTHINIGSKTKIGSNTIIENGTTIYSKSIIGERCHISSGVVIGACGFGYVIDGNKWIKISHLGYVEIGNDVDIGANSTIDRGSLDATTVGNGVKIDNHVHIAHNVQIGDDTAIAGCTAIAGSTRIGKRCKLGGHSSLLDHINIADDVTIYAGSLVKNSIVKPGGTYASMISVQPMTVWKKTLANIHRLNILANKIKIFGKRNDST